MSWLCQFFSFFEFLQWWHYQYIKYLEKNKSLAFIRLLYLMKTGIYKKHDELLSKISSLLENARNRIVREVDQTIVFTYWHIWREIVEFQQWGKEKAEYGAGLLELLSKELTKGFGKGFSPTNLRQMRNFYVMFPNQQTVSAKFKKPNWTTLSSESKSPIVQTVSAKFKSSPNWQTVSAEFKNLSWSHYVFLMQIDDSNKRNFYAIESNANNRSLRELKRQFDTSLYHRLALSKNKQEVKQLSKLWQIIEKPEDALKDPYVLEFLWLEEKSYYSEQDLESAIISHLQKFLLEMWKWLMFVERQKRITNNEEHYRIDLVFYHRFLKCFVLIDLKKWKLAHQDIGQMQMYVNYYDRKIKKSDENPTIWLLLCEQNNHFVVKYTLPKENKQIFSREYRLYLPSKKQLENQLRKKFEK